MTDHLHIRDIRRDEYDALGRLMVDVYSRLDGFPTPAQQPRYYAMLAGIGGFSEKPGVRVLVAVAGDGELAGGIVYFDDMAQYGSGGTATTIGDASGIRLLGVDARWRGRGVGRALADACIALARERGHAEMILHTTQAMQLAWRMYEGMGFRRAPDLDFMQEELQVVGFRLSLRNPAA